MEVKNKSNIQVSSAFICEIESYDNGNFTLSSNAPSRLCVIFLDKGIAVDVEDKLEYAYIECESGLYITNKIIDQNLMNKRVALFADNKSLHEIRDLTTLNYIKEIINEITLGKSYPNGNDVYYKEQFVNMPSNAREPIKVRRKEKKKK